MDYFGIYILFINLTRMEGEVSFKEHGIVSKKISVGIKEYTVYELDVTWYPKTDRYIGILKSTFNWIDYSRNGSEPTQYRSISTKEEIINTIVLITGKSREYAEDRIESLYDELYSENPPPLKRRKLG